MGETIRRRVLSLALAALIPAFGASCAKGYPGDVEAPEEEEEEKIPSDIQAVMVTNVVPAGRQVRVECVIFDQHGEIMDAAPGVAPRVRVEPEHLFERNKNSYTAAIVGEAQASCAIAAYGLYSAPIDLQIVPGPPHSTVIEVDEARVIAGTDVATDCYVYDAYGNEIADADGLALHVGPQNAGTEIDGLALRATQADIYNLSCYVPGAGVVEPAFLRVDPALPYSMTVGLRPMRASYRVLDHTILATDVRDRFGNVITGADLVYSASSPLVNVLGARYLFNNDGYFTLTAKVSSPIDEDVTEVKASVQVLVNSGGPDIECLRPDNGQNENAFMARAVPGQPLQMQVQLHDLFDIESVTIGGVAATGNSSGVYSATITPHWGMNFVNVVARDEHGEENSRTCFMLASEHYLQEAQQLDHAVTLSIGQPAVGQGGGPTLSTFNDLIRTVFRSPGLIQVVEDALVAANPLLDTKLGDLLYRDGTLKRSGADSELHIVQPGLRLRAEIYDVEAGVRWRSKLLNPKINGHIRTLSADATVAVRVENQQLRGALDGSVDVGIHGFRTSSSGGVASWIISKVANIFKGLIAGLLEDMARDAVTDMVGPILDDTLSSLDIDTIAPQFDIPRLDGATRPPGQDVVTLLFGKSFYDVRKFPSDKLVVGISTNLRAQSPAHAYNSLGVGVRSMNGELLEQVIVNRPIMVAVHEGMLNQALYALWRAGFFQMEMDLGDGGLAIIDAMLPPVITIESGVALLSLGGVSATVTIPPLFDDPPFHVQFGGKLRATVSVDDNVLAFGDIIFNPNTDLFISFPDSVSEAGREVIQTVVGRILQQVLVTTVNEALPSLPIPAFELPPEVAEFGFPAGAKLSVVNPEIVIGGQHLRVRGGFGVQ